MARIRIVTVLLFVVGIVNVSVAERAGVVRYRSGRSGSAVNVKVEPQALNLGGMGEAVHYGSVCGDLVAYGVGPACDFTWDIKYKNLKTGEVKSFNCGPDLRIDTRPRMDGEVLVWFGGPLWKNPWTHEPSNFSVFARDLTTGKQITLREYTMAESYGYPAISGTKVVWLEFLGLDLGSNGKNAKKWWKASFNVCGADVSDMENPRYFTIAKDVGKRDPYPCRSYSSDFDDVIDICGDMVVWESRGDIYGADLSVLYKIEVFGICADSGRQSDPAISENLVVWTDKRNDSGDIYGADISAREHIKAFPIAAGKGTQQQPAVDGRTIVYVDKDEINVRSLGERYEPIEIPLDKMQKGKSPAIDGNILIWQTINSSKTRARGIRIEYSIAD